MLLFEAFSCVFDNIYLPFLYADKNLQKNIFKFSSSDFSSSDSSSSEFSSSELSSLEFSSSEFFLFEFSSAEFSSSEFSLSESDEISIMSIIYLGIFSFLTIYLHSS